MNFDRTTPDFGKIEHCERISENTRRITNGIQELADSVYLAVKPSDSRNRYPLPLNWDTCWRKYTRFSLMLTDGLAFVCFSRLTPQ
ncbi:hypothetical protein ACYULU_12610 [Breznakiellaceae bacterium SP9]